MNKIYFFLIVTLCYMACEPAQDDSFEAGALPPAPEFTVRVLDNPNEVEVALNTDGYFSWVWDAPSGLPNKSTEAIDTFFYANAGDYDITLHVAAEGGGTSSSSQSVTITEDAQVACDGTVEILTDMCTNKCWKLSEAPGSVQVGPAQLSGEWYSSPSIVDAQINDRWCFFADGKHQYLNNGETFSACQGYIDVVDYPIPADVTYSVLPSGGTNSTFQIELSEGWMGVEDSGPIYEIVSITEDELILLSMTNPCDGVANGGWFTLTFVAE